MRKGFDYQMRLFLGMEPPPNAIIVRQSNASAIQTLPPEQDERRFVGSRYFSAKPITDPAFRTHDVLRADIGVHGEMAALPKGTYYGLEHALTAIQATGGTARTGYGRGTLDWCRGWPVMLCENRDGAFAVVIDLRRKMLAAYQVRGPQTRERVTVTQTVMATRRRTIWR